MEAFSWQIVIVTLTILHVVNFADNFFFKTSPLSLYYLTGLESSFFFRQLQCFMSFYFCFLVGLMKGNAVNGGAPLTQC